MQQIINNVQSIGSTVEGMMERFVEVTVGDNSNPETVETSAEAFVKKIRQKHRNISLPIIESGTFEEIVAKSHSTRSPLIIYIHSDSNDAFIKDVLSSEAISVLLLDSVFWALLDTSNDAKLLQKVFSIQRFPALLAIRADFIEYPILLDCNSRQFSIESTVEFLDHNYEIFRSLDPNARQVSAPDPRIEYERQLREQQEREYREAEMITRQRQQEEEKRRKQEEAEEIERRRAEEERLREIERKKQLLKPEPEASSDTVMLAFRLPGGGKKERRFMRGDTLGDVYAYVDTLDLGIPYEIVTSFPVQILDNHSASLEGQGLYPQAVVHIREKLD